jgi:hypothetical protein
MSVAKPRGPDFLVVGAQRAGTTWLHRVLGKHPGLWLPPVKELHYFNHPSRRRTLLDAGERKRIRWKTASAVSLWHVRYLLGARGDDWYARLFHAAQGRGLLAGETTPAYAVLGQDGFERIKRVNEGVKLIFIMRDPVDRAWSTVTNAHRKGRFGELTTNSALAWARNPQVAARSRYFETIETMETVFPSSQIHYGFFDDIRDNPGAFVADIFAFLGVAPVGDMAPMLGEAVNSTGRKTPMPPEFEREMAKDYTPIVRRLSERFEYPARNWIARYEALLAAPNNVNS